MTPERRQALLYLAVGGWNTIFTFATFAALQFALGEAVHYLAVLTTAWVVGVLQAFVAYRQIVSASTVTWYATSPASPRCTPARSSSTWRLCRSPSTWWA